MENKTLRRAGRGDGEGGGGGRAVDAAAHHVDELRAIADAIGTRALDASLSLSEGLVAAAAADHEAARARLEDAVELFAVSGASFELARHGSSHAGPASLGREDAA